MGELIRNYDWSKTPVGSMDGWPVSLRTAIGLMLTSRFPMLLFWGRGLITFYNDAFRSSLGTEGKHPAPLGQRGEESWAESWPTVGPIIQSIMAGGDAVWLEDQKPPIFRYGKMDDAHWTYTFSPVRDDEGEINGLLVTCAETTGAVENLQRLNKTNQKLQQTLEHNLALQKGLEESRQQLLGLFEQSPVAIAMLGKDRLTVKRANDFYCEIIDRKREDIIGKSLLDVLPEMAGQGFDGLMNGVITTGIPFTANEVPARLVRNGRLDTFYVNLTYNPVREPDGSVSGVFVVATDVTVQVLDRQRIEESRRQLLSLFDQSPVAIAVIDKEELRYRMANAFYGDLVGRTPEELIGRPMMKVLPEMTGQGFDDLLYNVIQTGVPFIADEVSARVQRSGQLHNICVNLAYQPLREADGTVSGVLIVATDITQQVAARNKVEEAAKKLNTLIQSVPVAIGLFISRDLIIETPNETFIEMVGRGRDIAGKPLRTVMPELESQPFLQLLDRVFTSGETFRTHGARLLRQRGGRLEERYFDVTFSPIFDESGAVTSVLDINVDVTEQVLARKRLEESEAKFRSLVQEAPFATALYEGKDLTIGVANQAMIKLWGKTPTVIGRPLAKALPELEGQPFLPLLQKIFQTGETYQATEQSADLIVDGRLQRFWFNFTYKPLFDTAGKVYAILNMALDVTEQVQARRRLEESELFIRTIVDNSPVAKIVFTGEDMVINTVNQNMMAMLGRDESIIGKPFMEAVPELIATPLTDRLRRVYATGETYVQPEEKLVLLKGGQPYTGYYQYIYKALYNTAGNIYGIICTATEITEQVEARKQIEQAEAALSAAIDLAELATWKIDFSTNKITYSPRLQEWLGGIQEAAVDLEVSSRVHGRDRARIAAALSKAIAPGGGNFDEVYTIVNQQTGQERIIHATGRTLYDADGKALSLSGTAQDVTMQKELQLALENEVQVRTEELAAAAEELQATNEELAETNAQLLRSNEELAQYAYVASHDLQEPLRKIRLFSSRLNPREQSEDEMQTVIEKIQGSADRMSLLIKDLLEFSRLLKSDSLLRPVNLNEVIKDVASDFELTVAEKEARIIVGALPVIEGVRLQMNQLFYNLVGNALKFTDKERKPVIQVHSRTAAAEEVKAHLDKAMEGIRYCLITVSDNGIGFEPKYLEQIFEVFKRLHGRTEFAGSGIGLAICRRIVQNHQGKIYAEAQPGKGASFHILLPEKQAAREASLPAGFTWKD